MNYCSIDHEWEAESLEEIDRTLLSHENNLKVLEKEEHILPRHIANIVNYGLNPDGTYYCFCECKKRHYKRINWKWRDNKEPRDISDSMVTLYTSDYETLRAFIVEFYNIFVDFEVKGLKENGYFKIDVLYSELIKYLIKVKKDMICDIVQYKDDFIEEIRDYDAEANSNYMKDAI
jgi:hypothetical protein